MSAGNSFLKSVLGEKGGMELQPSSGVTKAGAQSRLGAVIITVWPAQDCPAK